MSSTPKDREFLILQASCALPLLFPIYNIDGSPCLDGGVADPIPYERAFEVGCDRVIVILTRERGYVRGHEKAEKLVDMTYRKYPKFLDVMHRRAEELQQVARASVRARARGQGDDLRPA